MINDIKSLYFTFEMRVLKIVIFSLFENMKIICFI